MDQRRRESVMMTGKAREDEVGEEERHGPWRYAHPTSLITPRSSFQQIFLFNNPNSCRDEEASVSGIPSEVSAEEFLTLLLLQANLRIEKSFG